MSPHGRTVSVVVTGILFIVTEHVKVSHSSISSFVVHVSSSSLASAICCNARQVVAGLGAKMIEWGEKEILISV